MTLLFISNSQRSTMHVRELLVSFFNQLVLLCQASITLKAEVFKKYFESRSVEILSLGSMW